MSINKSVSMTDWDAGVRPKIEKINAKYPDLVWGTYNGHEPTKGRATDGMLAGYKTDAGNARGWACARWLWANRAALGIWYVIFDGKIISMTRPAAGWRTYYPTAAAIRNSPDSAYHRNHPHVSFYKLDAPAARFLAPYLVDPEKVSTFMIGNATRPRQDDLHCPPLFRITKGVRIDHRTDSDGDKTSWLITDDGREFYLPFLVLESEYKKRPGALPLEAPKPKSTTIYLDRLKPGQKDSDSVWLLQNLLNKVLGPNLIRSGTYDARTVDHVQLFQRDTLGWDDKSGNGTAGPHTVRELIKRAGRGYQYKTEEKA